MQHIPSWPVPSLPSAPGRGRPLKLYDSALERVETIETGPEATLYVCGITPYDATHLGHAATYLAFDSVQRAWRDAGITVHYAQNVTDVDDPLLEGADKTGVDWRALAEDQTNLFRGDMEALRILPPDAYVRVQDIIPETASAIGQLLEQGIAYRVPIAADATPAAVDADACDLYFDRRAAEDLDGVFPLGTVSHFDDVELDRVFREFGGDPERPGKRDPFDPLLWRAAREGEPAWETPFGAGRPGWHVECAIIANAELGTHITLQGGGRDLRFPHHEMSAQHASAVTGEPFATRYAHAGLIAYDGEKMSKSLGNLVLVSKLRERGVDPRAIRLAILAHRYREDWEWTEEGLQDGIGRLEHWCARVATLPETAQAEKLEGPVMAALREAMADDLDTPRMLEIVDAWVASEPQLTDETSQADAYGVPLLIDALLGIQLR